MTVRQKYFIVTISVIGLLLLMIFGPALWVASQQKYRDAGKLLNAIRDEDIDAVQTLLEAGVDPNQTDVPPSKYWSIFEFSACRPLAEACSISNYEIVRLLIEYGATAEYIEYTGWSPLQSTLLSYDTDDVEIIKLLLANGADPDTEEAGKHSVFVAAEMYPMLRGTEDFLTGYDETVATEITEIVQMLLTDQDIDLVTSAKETLLMYAAKRGNVALAEYCIAQGCDVNLKNTRGQTAYDLAVEHGKANITEVIKSRQRGQVAQGTVLGTRGRFCCPHR